MERYILLAAQVYMNPSLSHKTNITIPFGKLESILEWCENNCESEWKFDDAQYIAAYGNMNTISYDFYFESERDFVAFLIWKK